ncbi:MAG: hypothetical protein LDL41_21215, partial [Coleofasciculus sp. S288]|nr:hypothetical protein [Coleofasciculus sp. S288]
MTFYPPAFNLAYLLLSFRNPHGEWRTLPEREGLCLTATASPNNLPTFQPSTQMRIIFFGTPQFALLSLERLLNHP